MGKLTYCHCCGTILDTKESVYNITLRDVDTKEEKKLFDVCGKCGKMIRYMDFKPKSLTPTERRNPHFTSVVIKRPLTKPSKQMTVYDLLDYQLDQLKGLEVNKDDLKLMYKSGRRIYTVFQVRKWMNMSDDNMIKAMMLVYKYQTEDEKKSRETKYANSVGFNKPDAAFLTGMCRRKECNDPYIGKQMDGIKYRMQKYANQVTLYVNAEGIILEGV